VRIPLTTRLAAGALVAGTAFALLPAAPASAYCDLTFYQLTGYCSACEIVRPPSKCPN
jgi:hypothetical protein